nr:hypothetical protein [Tanacetum cinerariifolium]
VWSYLSHDNSLWSRVISAIHGLNGQVLSTAFNSKWSSIINEVNSLKDKGVDLISHCKIKVGKGTCTSFWNDLWIGDSLLKLSFPRLYALEEKKLISVADTMRTPISFSFRRPVQGGVESQQRDHLSILLDSVILSNMKDIWFWDLNGDIVFRVKDVRILLDEAFLPKIEVSTRWIKGISIKDVQKLICRWWNLDFQSFDSYDGWLSWFKSIRLADDGINEIDTEMPVKEAKKETEAENGTKNKPIKRAEKEETSEASSSQPVGYCQKHKINEKLIEGLVDNNRFNNSLSGIRVRKVKGKTYNLLPRMPVYEAILRKKITRKEDLGGNFEIPCNIGGLKHMNALVDQGSDVILDGKKLESSKEVSLDNFWRMI